MANSSVVDIPYAIRHYLKAMVETHMVDDVRSVLFGESGKITVQETPCCIIAVQQEDNTPLGQGPGFLEERELINMQVHITFAVTQASQAGDGVAEDLLDSLRYQFREIVKDDPYLMKLLADFKPEGTKDQGLSNGAWYTGTVVDMSDEGDDRLVNYTLAYTIPYETNNIPDYRADELTSYKAEFVDPVTGKILRTAEGDLT